MPKRSLDTYHHGDLYEAALQEAERILKDRGGGDISVRSIARGVGVSHAALYRHFPSREAILEAIALRGFHRLNKKFEMVRKGESPRARFRNLVGCYIEFAKAEPKIFDLMYSGQVDKSAVPELKAAGDVAFETVRGVMIDLGVPAPAKREAIAAWALAHGLAELLLSGTILHQLANSKDIAAMIERSEDIFIAGL